MKALKPCGTEAAYKRHLRHGEPTCAPCRVAHNAHLHACPSFPRRRPSTGNPPGKAPTEREYVMGEWELMGGPVGRVDFHSFGARVGKRQDAWERLYYRAREKGDPRAVRPMVAA